MKRIFTILGVISLLIFRVSVLFFTVIFIIEIASSIMKNSKLLISHEWLQYSYLLGAGFTAVIMSHLLDELVKKHYK